MISEEIKQIAAKLGQFFLQESNGDYDAACKEIDKLHIHRLEMKDYRLVIELSRPGLFIGKRGERWEAIQEYLKLPLHIEETKQDIVDYIYPYKLDDDYDNPHQDYIGIISPIREE